MISVKVYCVKFAFCGAHAAAETSVGIDNRSAAAETAGRFDFDLLFGESLVGVSEGCCAVDAFVKSRLLTGSVVIAFHNRVFLVKLDEIPAVSAYCETCMGVDVSVKRFGGAFSRLDGVDYKFRTGVNIASHKTSG